MKFNRLLRVSNIS